MDAILLGAVQGVTEFLPVSSSAHLVAAQSLLNVQAPGIGLEVALHLGTLVAILLVFWRDLARLAGDGARGGMAFLKSRDWQASTDRFPLLGPALAVAIGSVPVALVGVFLEDKVEATFESPTAAGASLLVTGLILLSTRFAPGPRTDRVGPARGLAIGLVQALALLPGISRSGATISAACHLGVDRRAAGRFSFLLAAPALAGAALWKSRHLLASPASAGQDPLIHVGALSAGVLVSAVVGTVCLVLLLRAVERGKLHWFAAYCLPAGVLMLALGMSS